MKDKFKIEDEAQIELGFGPIPKEIAQLFVEDDDEETEATAQEIEAEEGAAGENDDDGRGDWRQFRQKE